MTTMNTAWGGERVAVTFFIDRPRYERLQALCRDYGLVVGRDVSLALTLCRAIDLLDQHMDSLNTPEAMLEERLVALGPTRSPSPSTLRLSKTT